MCCNVRPSHSVHRGTLVRCTDSPRAVLINMPSQVASIARSRLSIAGYKGTVPLNIHIRRSVLFHVCQNNSYSVGDLNLYWCDHSSSWISLSSPKRVRACYITWSDSSWGRLATLMRLNPKPATRIRTVERSPLECV
jgi:hypothetical protein